MSTNVNKNSDFIFIFLKEGEGKVSNHNHVGHGYDDKTTYITVETRDGRLEQLKINLDDEDFQTSTSILEYLVERGEINPKSITVSQGTGNSMLLEI